MCTYTHFYLTNHSKFNRTPFHFSHAATIAMASSPKAHVAVLPFPFGSHPSALFFLTRKLAEWAPDVAFSFFCIAETNGYLSSWPTIPNLRIYDVADGVAEGHVLEVSMMDQVELFLQATPGNYREAIKRVDEIDKVSYVLSDAILWFAGNMAEKMGVPWVAFWNGSACSLSAHVNTDLIRQMIGTRPEEVSARQDESLGFIPGCSQFRVRELPEGIVVGQLDLPLFTSLRQMSQELPRAAAVLVNSIEEMDPTPLLDHLRTVFDKFLLVGPLSLLAPTRPDSESDPHSCLAWLGSQDPASVAYVGFGTVLVPPPPELAALAEGLEASGAHFLWSLKENHWESLPAGFLDRTRGRGLVVPCTPQPMLLSHVALGAFISHCGYNSVLESIMGGVPIICMPFFADQRINARVLSHVLGVAVDVKDGVLTKEGVMDALDLLLHREEGKKMRENIGSLQQVVKNAVRETGSATNNMKAVLEIIKGST